MTAKFVKAPEEHKSPEQFRIARYRSKNARGNLQRAQHPKSEERVLLLPLLLNRPAVIYVARAIFRRNSASRSLMVPPPPSTSASFGVASSIENLRDWVRYLTAAHPTI